MVAQLPALVIVLQARCKQNKRKKNTTRGFLETWLVIDKDEEVEEEEESGVFMNRTEKKWKNRLGRATYSRHFVVTVGKDFWLWW